ncbi:MAG: nucleotidyltransferase family protein [Woeseiaceae bacterium]|nr:nucleotidyltransferase family protein [Woeseiaceae bacterium]
MTYQSSLPVIHACILAAGTSTRFGATKLIQVFRSLPLIQHALIAAQGVCKGRVNLIVGHDSNAVIEASAHLANTIVLNKNFKKGIGTSIAAAADSCRQNADAILIMLADQPLVSTQHLATLIASWSGSENEIVASKYNEITGPPILFPRNTFSHLRKLDGESGAKQLLQNGKFDLRKIELPAAKYDVDTPRELNLLDQS